jgi:hypothetical protein
MTNKKDKGNGKGKGVGGGNSMNRDDPSLGARSRFILVGRRAGVVASRRGSCREWGACGVAWVALRRQVRLLGLVEWRWPVDWVWRFAWFEMGWGCLLWGMELLAVGLRPGWAWMAPTRNLRRATCSSLSLRNGLGRRLLEGRRTGLD